MKSYRAARETAVDTFEAEYIRYALAHAHGNVSQAAREADLNRVTFHRLMRKHGIKAERKVKP